MNIRHEEVCVMKKYVLFAILTAVLLALSGCGKKNPYTPSDDIFSDKPIDSSKTVITVGKYVAADTNKLEAALEAKFPTVDFVFTEPDAGDNDIAYMKLMSDGGKLEDIQFCAHVIGTENDFLYDLSGENFTGEFNLASLDSMSVGGKLYQVPVSNNVMGIAYNKSLFERNGWKIPEDLNGFYALCDSIKAAGIRPFAPCLKYFTVDESVAFGLSYDDVFSSAKKQVAYHNFYSGNGTCKGLLEPAFQAVRDLYDRGYINADDFSSSVTELRQDLYAGKIAMLPSSVNILAFAREEKPADEIGYIGYPTRTSGQRWMQMTPGSLLSVSAVSMRDAKKKQTILNALEYFTSEEGQKVLLNCFPGVSSLKNYTQEADAVSPETGECIRNGRIFFADYYASNAFVPTWQKYVTGEMPLEQFTEANDAAKPADYLGALKEAPIGTAAEDFTVLDTSLYNADVMREAAGSDIALILNGYFYTGNLARILKGEIGLPSRFVLKNVGAKNYLTTYEITGSNLKKLMEHPIIKGAEINALYACSGLKIEYAPWAAADDNVRKLTLADGRAIEDTAVYTVAAWAGSVDSSYISGTVQTFPDAGANKDLMTAAIKKAGTISPAHDGRVTLVWK